MVTEPQPPVLQGTGGPRATSSATSTRSSTRSTTCWRPVATNKVPTPNFEDGVRNQRVLARDGEVGGDEAVGGGIASPGSGLVSEGRTQLAMRYRRFRGSVRQQAFRGDPRLREGARRRRRRDRHRRVSGGRALQAGRTPSAMTKLKAFGKAVEDRGLVISALSCHGNPIHPDRRSQGEHHAVFEQTVQLAGKLGVKQVITFSGCPGGDPSATQPNWITAPWPPEYPGDARVAVEGEGHPVLDRDGEEVPVGRRACRHRDAPQLRRLQP